MGKTGRTTENTGYHPLVNIVNHGVRFYFTHIVVTTVLPDKTTEVFVFG